MRKEIGAPEGAPCDDKLGREGLTPANSTVRNRGERGCDVRVTQIHGGTPHESPLALEEIDKQEKHDDHRSGVIVQRTNRPADARGQVELARVSHAGAACRLKEIVEEMTLDTVRRALEPAIRRVLHTYWRFARGMTLGVRAIVIDPQGRVLLVKHSYVT